MLLASKQMFNASDTQKHSHPIPNRNYILKLLAKRNQAVSRNQLAKLMKLTCKEEFNGLHRRLRAMEHDGQITFEAKHGYRVINDNDKFEGRVIGHRDGFGFLATDDGGDDLLLSADDMLQLFDGDRIQVRLAGSDNRGRKKAALLKIIERNTTEILGQIGVDNGKHVVIPENSRIAQTIDIDKTHLMGAKAGQYVVVTLTDYPCHQYRALGRVTEVLGDANAPGMEIDVAIRRHGIPFTWSAEVTKEAEALGEKVIEAEKQHRADLRQLPFVTIDGEDARDFDDAVYCEPNARGWSLWVAIADVSHYVKPDSALDQEAQKRGTSVYFPGHVVPMLPERLSNGLCSLNPEVDRLVLACEMQINTSGVMTDFQFSEAIIHSHARLTYTQVNALLTSPDSKYGLQMKRQNGNLVPHINALNDVYEVLNKARIARGSIDFDSQEVMFKFNQRRKIDSILPVERNQAHKLIEECMLCANVATAKLLKQIRLPALYRNHHGPKDKKLQNLRAFLDSKQLTLGGGNTPSPAQYDNLLSHAGARPDAHLIKSMMLRSLSQAEYSPNNIGHFGLAYSAYTHFTSPIRRYPDLLVHRAIRSVIRGKQTGNLLRRAIKALSVSGIDPVKRIQGACSLSSESSYPYKLDDMQKLAKHCSALSRRADKASWDVEAWLKCDYMRDSIGDCFSGVITTVTQFGMFVELDDTKVEGLVHLDTLGDDYYHFDEETQSLSGERTNKGYAVGDRVHIQVSQVDMEQRKIAFRLAKRKGSSKL